MKNKQKDNAILKSVIKDYITVPDAIEPQFFRFYIFVNYGYKISFIVHIWFIFLFRYLNSNVLSYFNILSSIFYIFLIYLNNKGKQYLSYSLATIEFILHSILCVHYLGWYSGFQYYLLFLPLTLQFLPSGKKIYKIMNLFFVVLTFVLLHINYFDITDNTLNSNTQTILYITNITSVFILVSIMAYYYRNAAQRAEKALINEYDRSEKLLLNILPQKIAKRLKGLGYDNIIADGFMQSSILFADIVNFSHIASVTTPEKLVRLLNRIFTKFDILAEKYKVEKIKTIGDSYMVVSGVPEKSDIFAEKLADFALELSLEIKKFQDLDGHNIKFRIGIASGPIVAGVIGKRKFTYDLWGDTVNIASRMESHGIPNKIQTDENTYKLLKNKYSFTKRGAIEIKGKGKMNTFILESKIDLKR